MASSVDGRVTLRELGPVAYVSSMCWRCADCSHRAVPAHQEALHGWQKSKSTT
jgi:hypothetical protein